jgi:hypothetical protein
MPDWHQLRRILAVLCVIAVVVAALVPANSALLLAVLVPFAYISGPVLFRARRIYRFAPQAISVPLLSAAAFRAPPLS